MKKKFYLVLLITVFLAACGSTTTERTTAEETKESSTEETKELSTEEKVTVEETEQSETTDDTYVDGTIEFENGMVVSHVYNIWGITPFTDEFGVETDEKYMLPIQYFEGTFSNSAVSNEPLYVDVRISDYGMEFFLYEYNTDSEVKNNFTNKVDYDLSILYSDGRKEQFPRGAYYESQSNILNLQYDENNEPFQSILEDLALNEGIVQFYIQESDSPLKTYKWSVDGKGLGEVIQHFN